MQPQTGYAAVTEYTAYNSGNLTPLTIGTTSTTALAGNTSLFDGAYSSLSGTPTLGTAAAAATGDFATAAQGTKADSALQSETFSSSDVVLSLSRVTM